MVDALCPPLTCLCVSLLAQVLPATAGDTTASGEDGIDSLRPGAMTIAVFHPATWRCHLPQRGTVKAASDWQMGQPLELPVRDSDSCFRIYLHPPVQNLFF